MKISDLAGDAWPEPIRKPKPSEFGDVYSNGYRRGYNSAKRTCNLAVWIDEEALFTILCIAKYKRSMKDATKYVSENMHKFVRVGRREDAKRD